MAGDDAIKSAGVPDPSNSPSKLPKLSVTVGSSTSPRLRNKFGLRARSATGKGDADPGMGRKDKSNQKKRSEDEEVARGLTDLAAEQRHLEEEVKLQDEAKTKDLEKCERVHGGRR